MNARCVLFLAALWAPAQALIECSGNTCFTNCQRGIAEFTSGRCTSGSAQQDLCSCSIQQWQCTAQCGCFNKAICDSQQTDWGSSCTLRCQNLSNIPGAVAATPNYGFLSFDSSDGTYYFLDVLFVLLAVLAACCCLAYCLTACCVAYSLLRGNRRTTYTDMNGNPVSAPGTPQSILSTPNKSMLNSPTPAPLVANGVPPTQPFGPTVQGVPLSQTPQGPFPSQGFPNVGFAQPYPQQSFTTVPQGQVMGTPKQVRMMPQLPTSPQLTGNQGVVSPQQVNAMMPGQYTQGPMPQQGGFLPFA